MLDSLTFLFEKFFLFSNFNIFKSLSEKEPDSVVKCPVLRRGDLLEVHRTIFIHYGIYLGNNRVAHLMPDIMLVLTNNKQHSKPVVTNKRLLLGCMCRKASIRVDSVEDFRYGAQIMVNDMDMKMKCQALASEEVARRAEKLVGDIPYSLLWSNCEHFATYCRYGTPVSQQTAKFCDCLKTIIWDQRSVALTVGIGVIYILCFGLAPSTILPTILFPFILWMAG
ncbi:Lecithin retinol acyltransferase [Labeo rohita]|uniref:Lecithin retinol acyltransferase n=1 Tax=Labeo rohita TaxID=84645 RepID=A0ABQ8N0S0_LABRO|nr:lecithin retinol acyltransferase [Labeo rohita]KAI2668693.1 Lecithin retinol acyltransferase [Labeo rohita]